MRHARIAGGASASLGRACCAQALCALGDTFLAKGQALQAIKCREAVCELHSAGGSQLGEARSRLELARLLLAHTHDVPVARKQLDRAVQPVLSGSAFASCCYIPCITPSRAETYS